MHTLTLVTVDLPEIQEDKKTDLEIKAEIKRLQGEMNKNPAGDFALGFRVEQLNSVKTTFSRAIASAIAEKMDFYSQDTENPDYLEFEDYTGELKKEYENNAVDCVKFSDGKIISVRCNLFTSKYTIHDGDVYEVTKRNPRIEKLVEGITILSNVPYKKLYKTFAEFAEKESYYEYNEEHGGYGYMFNPNAFWDWYSIGGRWPKLFLVKENCTEVSVGTRTCDTGDEQFKAPDGYKWVCAARKKDIQWQTMSEWKKNKASEDFKMFEQWFKDGKCPKDAYVSITENSIETFGSKLYIKGETLDENLSRLGIVSKYKYPNLAHAYLADDGRYSADDVWRPNVDDSVITETWRTMLDDYIDAIPDDTVIVGVDCHM